MFFRNSFTSSTASISTVGGSRRMFTLGSSPLYFQYPADKSIDYKQQSQIISISPAGFTMRHIDVSSLNENAYEFRYRSQHKILDRNFRPKVIS